MDVREHVRLSFVLDRMASWPVRHHRADAIVPAIHPMRAKGEFTRFDQLASVVGTGDRCDVMWLLINSIGSALPVTGFECTSEQAQIGGAFIVVGEEPRADRRNAR